jgi:hypothetical protein
MSPADSWSIRELMSEFLSDSVQDRNALFHDFRSDAITGQNSDFQIHSLNF